MIEHSRRNPLSEEEIAMIVAAIKRSQEDTFHLSSEEHYAAHKRLDRLLDAFDAAQNIFWKAFLGAVIIGALFLASFPVFKH